VSAGDTDRAGVPRIPECHDDVCITCSDSAVEVTVVELLDHQLAVVDTGSGHEEVSVALVSASLGDRILVHAREAIATVSGEGSPP
jgi:hydrogenase maturation factor